MTANASQQGHRVLSRRRIAILATVVGLGTAAMYTDHAFGPPTATNALYSPSEWPASAVGSGPPSARHAR